MGQVGNLHLGAYFQSRIFMGKSDKYKGLFEGQGSFDIPCNPYVSPFGQGGAPNPNFIPLGMDGSMGFGRTDMNIFKIGAEVGISETFLLTAGYSYGKQPIPESEMLFDILAPAVTSNHIAAGFTKFCGDNELNFSVMYAPKGEVSEANAFDPVQTVTLEMSRIKVEVGFLF